MIHSFKIDRPLDREFILHKTGEFLREFSFDEIELIDESFQKVKFNFSSNFFKIGTYTRVEDYFFSGSIDILFKRDRVEFQICQSHSYVVIAVIWSFLMIAVGSVFILIVQIWILILLLLIMVSVVLIFNIFPNRFFFKKFVRTFKDHISELNK